MFDNIFSIRNCRNSSIFIISILLLIGLSIIHITPLYAVLFNTVTTLGKTSDSSGETIQIKMIAINNTSGSSSTFLVGKGAIIQRDNNGSILQHAIINVRGNMSTNTIFDLTGNVTKSNDPSMIGKPISITADASTGYTTLTFGYSNYTGIENVIIK